MLSARIIEDMDEIDSLLKMYYQKKIDSQEPIGFNVIRACSEAILYAAASCYDRLRMYKGINIQMYN